MAIGNTIIAVWPILAIMVGYAALSTLAQILANPARLRLIAIVEDLINDKRATEADRRRLEFLLDTSTSWKVAALMPVAMAGFAADVLLKRAQKPNHHWLFKDPRMDEAMGYFLISISAANIVMAVLNVTLFLLFVPVFLFMQEDMKDAWEEPVYRAAHSLKPAH